MNTTTNAPLRVLLVEDSEDDATLLVRALRKGGFEPAVTRVQTDDGIQRALENGTWDIVISDNAMPGFSAFAALDRVKRSGLDLPFIIVSGSIGEETAVEAMKAGAHDFVMKDRLGRLCPSVQRELAEARVRHESRAARLIAEEAVRKRDRAEAASQAKGNFLANVSHELRTPLNTIIGFSELLQDPAVGSLNPRQAEYLRHVASSGRHLLSLINEILDLSKIEAGQMNLHREPLPVQPLVQSVHDALAPLADKQGVALVMAVPADLPDVLADPGRVRQILSNLLSNAIKFTPSGGRVRIHAQQEGAQLALSVEDTGIGIADVDLPKLFRTFERIPGSGPQREGTGLGLALTKHLVELHGGTISVTSRVGQGSTFTTRLPLAADRAPLVAAPVAGPVLANLPTAEEGSQRLVLIVDDDPMNRELLRNVLQRRGHQVLQASRVDEARRLLVQRPALVITDLQFPGGGGLALLKIIREDERLARTPVLVMTAHAMEGERARLLSAGFDAYLSKPTPLSEVAASIDQLLARSEDGDPI